jgi:hypothetical protein
MMRTRLQPVIAQADGIRVADAVRPRAWVARLGAWRSGRRRASQLFHRLPAPAKRPAAQPIPLADLPPRPYDATVYRVRPLSDEWVVVELDPDSHEPLSTMHAHAQRGAAEIAAMDVYLAWDESAEAHESQVSVRVDRHGPTVGKLTAEDSVRFRSALEVANRQGQVASTCGYLAPADGRTPPYLLTLHPPIAKTAA